MEFQKIIVAIIAAALIVFAIGVILEIWKDRAGVRLILLSIILFAAIGPLLLINGNIEGKRARQTYNNGIHKTDGGHWEFISGNRGTFYYKCSECGGILRTGQLYGEVRF